MTTTLERGKKHQLLLELMTDLIQEERPDAFDLQQLEVFLSLLGPEVRNGSVSRKAIYNVHSCFGQEFLNETLLGRALIKPNGYAGDYLLLDRIYTSHTSKSLKYNIWDVYFQEHAAFRAIRKSKEYFKKLIWEKAFKNTQLKVLHLVNGTGRDLLEVYSELPANHNLKATCVALDDAAIDHAKNLNKKYLEHITFHHESIFCYKNRISRDVIWSAGLFNYLDDRAFVILLNNFKEWLNPGGEIIIGNYNEDKNPSRDYMEILCDWFLHHRTEEQLKALGEEAGFKRHQIRIGRESENIILFLHLRADQT
ncbi:MAG TPA: class I SAM-dependent methyltransferase [Eudoraea sp.]|nr:class I SAM-dependent methyltransferase [Eudoraea sp.]